MFKKKKKKVDGEFKKVKMKCKLLLIVKEMKKWKSVKLVFEGLGSVVMDERVWKKLDLLLERIKLVEVCV